jgi:hypothetical protein
MSLPNEPVTLSPEQIAELNKKLAGMRHDVNNDLSLILAAAEIARHKPQSFNRMLNGLEDKPKKISETIAQFSQEFEKALGISKP